MSGQGEAGRRPEHPDTPIIRKVARMIAMRDYDLHGTPHLAQTTEAETRGYARDILNLVRAEDRPALAAVERERDEAKLNAEAWMNSAQAHERHLAEAREQTRQERILREHAENREKALADALHDQNDIRSRTLADAVVKLTQAQEKLDRVGAAQEEMAATADRLQRIDPNDRAGHQAGWDAGMVGSALAGRTDNGNPEPPSTGVRDPAETPKGGPCATCGHDPAAHHKLHCEAPGCFGCNGWTCPRHGLTLCGCTYLGGPNPDGSPR